MRVPLIPTIAAAVVVATTASLGGWQLRRADEKTQAQAARDAALSQPPVRIGAQRVDPDALDGRRVALEGELDAARTIFLDNRTRNGVAGFHVLTPLAPAGGDAAAPRTLVLRGWIARDPADRTRLPPLVTPAGPVRIEGLAVAELPQPRLLGGAGTEAREGAGGRLWQRFDPAAYVAWATLPIQPVIVRQTSALDDGLARDWAEPGSGVDKHVGYAVQWFAMAAVTLALWAWFAVIAPRRRPGAPQS